MMQHLRQPPVIATAAGDKHLGVCAESLDASKHKHTLPQRDSIVALRAAAVELHLSLSEPPAHFSWPCCLAGWS